MARRVPLAWLNLTHDPIRLSTSLAGIVFSIVLMFMEYGFWNALMDSTAELVRTLDADDNDLIMISASKLTLAARARFSVRRLYEARAFAAVTDAFPIYIEARTSIWRNPATGKALKIRVLAFHPDQRVFRRDVVGPEAAEALKRPGTALIDALSQSTYGPRRTGTEAVLSRRKVLIVGMFRLGTDFVTDGTLIMSDQNFLKYIPDRRLAPPDLRDVDLGLLKVAPGTDLVALVRGLRAALPGDVAFATRDQLIDDEQRFWMQHTPVGTIFGFGMAMGFVVGVVICYQILSSDIRAHMAEYATLKAIGYGNGDFLRIVFDEALILSLLGFAPGQVLSLLLYEGLSWGTGLLMSLTPGRAALILALTVSMCVVSGCVAIRKLSAADPVELFK
jgi:putative ABC transport system permease protein